MLLLPVGTGSGPVSGPDAQHAVSELLRRAEYHRQDPSFVSRVWNWVLDRLDSLFSGGTAGNALLVLLALVAVVIVFAIVRAGPPRRSRRRTYGADADPLRPLAATDHRRLAESLSAAGDLHGAVREWLRAAIQTLEERGVLLPRPGRTGAGAAREAAPLIPDAAEQLAVAAAAFDEVWFGGRPATEADVAAGRRAADAVRHAQVSGRAVVGGFAVPA